MTPRKRPLAIFLCLLGAADAALGATTVSSPFQGVTWYNRVESSPRTVVINVVEIDLTFPGLSFSSTPSNGASPYDVTASTTKAYVASVGAQIGINGDFYSPLSGSDRDLSHMNMSQGQQVSPWSGGGSTKEGALNVSATNVATVVSPFNVNIADYKVKQTGTSLYTAVGGNERLISAGSVIATDTSINPRTAVGVKGTKLYLLTVDGRQTGYSEGMSTIEVANVLKNDYGCTDALNLDGGGSTSLVFADPTARTINSPSDGSDRQVANSFVVFAPLWPQWTKNGDGTYSTAGNWAGSVPNGVGKSADFKNAITQGRTITLDIPVTLGTLNLANANTYTLAGTNSLTLDATTGSAAVNVTSGSHVISAPVILNDPLSLNVTAGGLSFAAINNAASKTITKTGSGNLNMTGSQTHGAATTINLSGGNVTFSGAITAGLNSRMNVTAGNVSFNGALNLAAGSQINVTGGTASVITNLGAAGRNIAVSVSNGGLTLNTTQRLPSLSVTAGGTVSMLPFGNRIINTKTLSMSGTGKIDLNNNHLIVDYDSTSPLGTLGGASYTGVTGMLASAFANGAWSGPGIGSSMAASDGKSLGIAEASEIFNLSGAQTRTFGTETLDATSLLVKYTWPGDANLDLRIDMDDFFRIDYGYSNRLAGWASGDFNYDGHVTAADYQIIDNAYYSVNGITPPQGMGLPRDQIVPEPSGALLLLCAGWGLRSRRRTRA